VDRKTGSKKHFKHQNMEPNEDIELTGMINENIIKIYIVELNL